MTKVLVLRTAGTNCDEETGYAFHLAGAEVESLHTGVLVEGSRSFDEFDILALPGGFSYGDDLGAGTVLASQLQSRLGDALRSFVDAGKLVIGICNGFQVLVRLGILPGGGADGDKSASLIENVSGRFEDRWVRLRVESDASPFLAFARGKEGSDRIVRYPVAHKEGRFALRDDALVAELRERGQIAFTYAAADSDEPAGGAFPANPNGSIADIAGITNAEGNVLGLMPHPERFLSALHDPLWTRGARLADLDPDQVARAGDGFSMFAGAVSSIVERAS